MRNHFSIGEFSLGKTKILCTIGPSSESFDILKMMHEVGMVGVRINTIFGDFNQYERIIENTRKLGNIPILMDINGAGLRIKVMEPKAVKKGDRLTVNHHDKSLSFNYDIYKQLNINDHLFFDDGKLQTKVVKKGSSWVQLLVENNWFLIDGKGVNIPRRNIIVPSFSEKDLEIIQFAKNQEIEFLGLSFTRNQKDIQNLKTRMGNSHSDIIAKIENFQGVKNLEEILRKADGIMIARGDLGIEIEVEKVPLIQKQMIKKCNQKGKLVITATDMLRSMTENPSPTRAEVSDVANAILDGTDVIMLSEETAIGKHPIDSVSMINKIANHTEIELVNKIKEEGYQNISSAISRSVWQLAQNMPLDKIVTLTRTGYTARMIARFKLKQSIIAVTPSRKVKNKLKLVFGVYPIQFNYEKQKDRILKVAEILYSKNLLNKEDIVLFTAGFRTLKKHASNIIEIHTINELLEYK
jgi:pyruvate kinase